MKELKIKKLSPTAQLPTRATGGSAGYDLYADLAQAVDLHPGQIVSIPTGIAIAIETSMAVGLVFGRSGLGIRHGVAPANAVGVIDADYRGEIQVGLTNHGQKPLTIAPGDRIAQLVLVPIFTPALVEEEQLPSTLRGEDGFGSTGR